jgi:flagellar operon protein
MQEVDGVKVPFVPIGGVDGIKPSPQISTPQGKSFDEVLRGELDSLKFSHHAQTRLESRNIQLSNEDIKQISDAVDQAGQKGSRDSLIIMKDVAFIVNVKNRTVVTAVDGDKLNQNVFTNIDSAVLINKQ